MSNIWEDILDAMVEKLAPIKIPDSPDTIPPAAYLRHLARYTGEFFTETGLVEGLAGRTPAVLIAFTGERPDKLTIGRRKQRAVGSFTAICITDSHRSREDRASLYQVLFDVRQLLVGQRLGLPIWPLRYEGILVVGERAQAFAWGIRLSTTYPIDWTVPPPEEELLSLEGAITDTADPPNTLGEVKAVRP